MVTNNTVAPLYLDKVVDSLTTGNPNISSVENVILPDGEQYKDMVGVLCLNWGSVFFCAWLKHKKRLHINCQDTLMKVFDKAIESRLDRKCTFVALGGGVIGDMCGFAAAAFLRGVNFIQIPTTVMAQVYYYFCHIHVYAPRSLLALLYLILIILIQLLISFCHSLVCA